MGICGPRVRVVKTPGWIPYTIQGGILDKYNMLALPETHMPTIKRSDLLQKARYYNYSVVRSIAKGEEHPGHLAILDQFSAASRHQH